MDTHIRRYCMFMLLVAILAEAQNSSTDQSLLEPRQSRATGRIVKLYAGYKPEPIHCISEGFQADPKDCGIFYRCMKSGKGKYTVFLFECGPGTIYDPDTEVCNYPRSTKRLECGGLSDQSLDSNDMNEIDEVQQELPSPIMTHSPVYTERTIQNTEEIIHEITRSDKHNSIATTTERQELNKSTSPTSKRIITTAIYEDSKTNKTSLSYSLDPFSSSSTMQSLPTTANPQISYISSMAPDILSFVNQKPNLQNNLCKTDGFMGDYENCHKFYRCVRNQIGGFTKYDFSCSESTVWDDDIQACNHPWAVKRSRCGKSGITTDVTKVLDILLDTTPSKNLNLLDNYDELHKTINQKVQINHDLKAPQTQTQITHQIGVQNQSQINYGDHINKLNKSTTNQNQTQINYGSPISQSQIHSQISYGNEVVKIQLPIEYSNQLSQTQTQINDKTTKRSNTTSIYDNQEQLLTHINLKNTNECIQSGFMGDFDNCKKFYRCVDNGKGGYIRYEFSCGEGTLWDQKVEACNHAWAVKNCGSKPSSQENKIITSTTTMKLTQSYTTSIKSTENYNAIMEETNNNYEDIGYSNQNHNPLTTISSAAVASTITNDIQPGNTECRSGEFEGDIMNCKIFYKCVGDGKGGYTKHKFECRDGTVWDPDIKACNRAEAVKKCGGSTIINTVGISSKGPVITTQPQYISTTIFQISTEKEHNDEFDLGYGFHTNAISSSTNTVVQNYDTTDECTSIGFFGDKNDCSKFYRCVDNGNSIFTRYEFFCEDGTVWDSTIESCNHGSTVNNCSYNGTTTIKEETNHYNQNQGNEGNDSTYTSQNPNYYNTTTYKTTQITSTIKSEVGNSCNKIGYMGDSIDCKKFYRCVDNGDGSFKRYEFSCGDGTVWDQKIQGCNHGWAVEKCGWYNEPSESGHLSSSEHSTLETSQDNKENYLTQNNNYYDEATKTSISNLSIISNESCMKSGFYGDIDNCQKFYKCVDDGNGGFVRHEFNCSKGTVWDQKIEACNNASINRNCTIKDEYNIVHGENSTQSTMMAIIPAFNENYSATKENRKSTMSTTSEKPFSSNGNCKSEGFFGDPMNCKKFYRCVNNGKGDYDKFEFTCGDGTIWDQEITACDHESSDNNCTASSMEYPNYTTEHKQGPGGDSSTNTVRQEEHSTQKIQTSSNNHRCTSEGFHADPNDCKKFFRCISNNEGAFSKYDFSCGEGTIWIQEIQSCDHDNGDANCSLLNESESKQPVDYQNSSTSSSITPDAPTSPFVPNSKGDDKNKTDESSSVNCSSEGYYGDKTDCKKFYRCVDNGNGGLTMYEFICGEGTAWDDDIKGCNHINLVESCQTTNSTSETDTADVVYTSTVATTNTQESNSTDSNENGSSNDKDVCSEQGYFGNISDCKKFYRCVDNGKDGFTKHNFICGDGTIWDQDITACNHPQDVASPSCEQDKDENSTTDSSASTTITSTSTISPTTQSSTSTDQNGEHSPNNTQVDTTKQPVNINFICTEAGYFPNPNDCKKFYRCVDWDGDGSRFSIFHFECGEGTIWDQSLQTCNHKESVIPKLDCSGTGSQTENAEHGTSITEGLTTQELTTGLQTTQEISTQETTTNPQITKQTTTEGTTTPEQTTTQKTTTVQLTTTEQTTTQQQTTTDKTTSQESTTSKQTINDQTTLSQQPMTTTPQETVQPTTINEHPTTQQSTTFEETTTEQSTPTEEPKTTTEKESTTSEQTTTIEISTESNTVNNTTTQKSTTEQNTQKSTDYQITTIQATMTDPVGTTEISTTEGSISTTTQSGRETSTTEGNQETTTEDTSSSGQRCPETDDDQYLFVCPTSFRRHPKYCNLFYQCTEDDDSHDAKVAVFKCPNNTIYDESKIQCVEEDKAEKSCDGEIASRRRVKRLGVHYKEPIVVTTDSHSCLMVGHIPFEKNSECSPAFIKCEKSKSGKLRGYVYQCPQNYIYWSISRKCERKENVRNCKRTINNWDGRWGIPIEKHNVAW